MAWSSGIHGVSSAALMLAARHPAIPPQAQIDGVMLFGMMSAIAVASCYLNRDRNQATMLAFAASLAAAGIYGFLEGAWPLGLLESFWAIDATRRGLLKQTDSMRRRHRGPAFVPDLKSRQSRYGSRYGEVFGSN
jgi:hypothetical protein